MASSFISFVAWKHSLRCNLKFLPLSVFSTGDPLLEVETDVLDLRGMTLVWGVASLKNNEELNNSSRFGVFVRALKVLTALLARLSKFPNFLTLQSWLFMMLNQR